MKSNFYVLIILCIYFSCAPEKESLNPLQQKIQGTWIHARASNTTTYQEHPSIEIIEDDLSDHNQPFALRFTKDKVEFFNQFIEYKRDSATGKYSFDTFVGSVPYQIKTDSLFIHHPLQHNSLVFMYTIDASKKDTLMLQKNNTPKYTLVPLPKQQKDTMRFDQVVLSRSGCFGSCPIMNISLHRNGKVLFQGEKHTDTIGLFQTTLSPKFTKYIFEKLDAIKISKVHDSYRVGHTDDETISSTFIHNGTIVKTISDYGGAGTKEMMWAYNAILNVYRQLQLTTVAIHEEIPALNFMYLKKDKKRLFLTKSEAFVLWTALQNATMTSSNIALKYVYDGGFYASNLKKVETNGQLFKLYLDSGEITTYDIGYNFIERNFSEADFKK